MSAELLLQLLGPLAAAVGVYAGIRGDLARLHERTETTRRACDHAHERIDAIAMRGTR